MLCGFIRLLYFTTLIFLQVVQKGNTKGPSIYVLYFFYQLSNNENVGVNTLFKNDITVREWVHRLVF